jgi:hypothetical protein
VSTTTGGGTGGSGGGLAGAGGMATGGTGGGTGGMSTGGTGGMSTGGTGGMSTGGTGGSSNVTLPTGCVANPSQVQLDCNPVTNEGCDTAAGQACDFSQSGWTCYDPPNDAKSGDTCDVANGPYCQGTLTCDIPPSDAGTSDAGASDAGGDAGQNTVGTCKHYCCSDSDCNGGTCTAFNTQFGTLGVCN